MRALGLVDLLVIAAVIALLVFAASKDFPRYGAHSAGRATLPAAPAPN